MAGSVVKFDDPVTLLNNTCTAMMRRKGKDLSARQLGILLTCYLQRGPHTVSDLATELNATKPQITRAVGRLEAFGFLQRKINPSNRRRAVIQRTKKGVGFLHQLRRTIADVPEIARFAAGEKVAA